jgi:hypothetical protein
METLNIYECIKYLQKCRKKLEQIEVRECLLSFSAESGCETWSLTLRDERRLRVFEKRVLRRVFGPKRDEVTGEWRKLHNEELNDLYSLPILRRW